jgi:hypothetical protein
MNCPSCQSEDTQRLQVAYEYGTEGISTQSVTIDFLGNREGGIGGAGYATKTTGQAQSILAKKASPPNKISYKWPLISLGFGLFILYSRLHPWMGLLLAGLGGYFICRGFRFNNQVWPDLYREWITGWVCHKCGNIYYQT